MEVRRQPDGQSATSLREATLVETVLVEIIGIVEQLSRDIVVEEERVQIFDENAPAYSTLAKSLKVAPRQSQVDHRHSRETAQRHLSSATRDVGRPNLTEPTNDR